MRVKPKFDLRTVPAMVLFLSCAQAHANQINGSLKATSLFSDNTLKKSQEPMDERQDLYQAGFTAGYSNWLVDAAANYEWVSQRYAENSQVDEEYADGNSSVIFGKSEDPFAVELNHSRRMLLTTPDAVGLTENQQERDVISVLPEIRKNIFGADRISLGGQFVRVNFPENELQNSKRKGYSLGWLHPLSKTSALQASAQQQKITFDHYPLADYTFNSSMVAYAVALRKLKYRLEFGFNESDPESGDKEGAPSYKLSAMYLNGFNQIDFSVSRVLTDTSFGNGNLENSNAVPGSDGLSLDIDRVDRTSAELKWQTEVVCSRCLFSAGVSAVEDDYLEKDERSLSVYTQSRFSYSFSNAANLSLGLTRSDVDFDNTSIAQDYELNYLSIEYAYHFVNGLNFRLAGKKEDRKATNENGDGTYKENVYSIGLGYNF